MGIFAVFLSLVGLAATSADPATGPPPPACAGVCPMWWQTGHATSMWIRQWHRCTSLPVVRSQTLVGTPRGWTAHAAMHRTGAVILDSRPSHSAQHRAPL